MKRIAAILLAALLLLSGCVAEKEPIELPGASESGENGEHGTHEESLTPYTVVVPTSCSAKVRALAREIANKIYADTGVALRSVPDALSAGQTADGVSEYEILLANTNRSASAELPDGAGSGGWWVRMSGTRIVVNAKNVTSLSEAVEYFLSKYKFENDAFYVAQEDFKVQSREDAMLSADISLKVGTYNIKNGDLVDHDFSLIAQDISALSLDIVGLQEVDVGTRRAQNKDTVRSLAELCGYEYYKFAKAMDFNGGEYGTAILSKYPILSFEVTQLADGDGCEPRSIGHAVIEVSGQRIDYYNTHLAFESKTVRQAQYAQIKTMLAGSENFILSGDFNCDTTSELYSLGDVQLLNRGSYMTGGAGYLIDNVVLHGRWLVNESGMKSSQGHSDHQILWAQIKYSTGL